MRRIGLKTAGIGAVATVASIPFGNGLVPLSVLVGSLLSITNFWILSRIIHGFLSGTGSKSLLMLISLGKYLFLGLILWWIVTKTFIHPLALLVGLSTILIPLVLEGWRKDA